MWKFPTWDELVERFAQAGRAIAERTPQPEQLPAARLQISGFIGVGGHIKCGLSQGNEGCARVILVFVLLGPG